MEKIDFNNGVLSGKAVIKGTRISVNYILEMLASGMSIDEILFEYEILTKEDIVAALEYANKILKHERIISQDG